MCVCVSLSEVGTKRLLVDCVAVGKRLWQNPFLIDFEALKDGCAEQGRSKGFFSNNNVYSMKAASALV